MKHAPLTREALLHRLQKALPYLRRRFGVMRLSLYGSFAQDTANRTSDVDLLVELSRPLGLEFVALAQYLERKLGRRVDLATFETLRRSHSMPKYQKMAARIQESLIDVQEAA